MLQLKILKPVTIIGQEYQAGDTVEVHKTLIHHEVKKVPSALQALLAASAIQAVDGQADTYKVVADIVVNIVGREYRKGAQFHCGKVFDYVDEVDFPKWIGKGVTDGLWSLDDGVVHVASVSLSDATISVDVGATKQLSATVLPADAADKSGVWASSDPAVATVDQTGKVTGVKAGSANITFTTTDGGKVGTSAATITIPVIVPTSVTMSPASPTVAVGATVKLTVAITPSNSTDKTGVWTSATPAVATVAQDGTVTGVSEGTSDITFTTNSGGKTAKRTVTVTAAA